jgi:uncharacterized protein (TIGR03086 family)
MSEDVREVYRRARDGFNARVHAIGDGQWHDATPCTEWDVRDLVAHLVGEVSWMTPLLSGESVADVGDRLNGDLLGDDPVAAWDRAIAAATDAVMADGAMERPVILSRRQPSGEDYTYEVISDLIVHAWDLARGIGAEETLEPDLVEVVFEKTVPTVEAMRAGGAVGPALIPPDGADRQTQLLAILGRQAW